MLDGIESHRPATLVFDALFIEPVPNFPHGLTIVIPLKRLSYKRRSHRINLKMAVCIDGISKGDSTAGKLALEAFSVMPRMTFSERSAE